MPIAVAQGIPAELTSCQPKDSNQPPKSTSSACHSCSPRSIRDRSTLILDMLPGGEVVGFGSFVGTQQVIPSMMSPATDSRFLIFRLLRFLGIVPSLYSGTQRISQFLQFIFRPAIKIRRVFRLTASTFIFRSPKKTLSPLWSSSTFTANFFTRAIFASILFSDALPRSS